MSKHLLRHPIKLGGKNNVCEIDETCLGRQRKYNRGETCGSGYKWIFGILDVEMKKCHLQIVPNRSREVLSPIIEEFIIRCSIIHSDEFSTYANLEGEGYIHKKVKHKEFYVNFVDGTHTNNIENFWTHVKNIIHSFHDVYNDMLPNFIDEIIYRWNRKLEGKCFSLLLEDIAEQNRVN